MKYPVGHPFSLAVEDVVTQIQTNIHKGISQNEASKRSEMYGLNIFKRQKQKSLWVDHAGTGLRAP